MSKPLSLFWEIESAVLASVGSFSSIKPKKSLYINSIPKSGTMLLKTVLKHIFGSYAKEEIVFYDSLVRIDVSKFPVSFGHLVYQGTEVCEVGRFDQRIQIVRHPYDLLIALVRTAYDPRHDRPDCLKARNSIKKDDYMSMVIDGYEMEGICIGPFETYIEQFIGTWLASDARFFDHSQLIDDMRGVVNTILSLIDNPNIDDLDRRIYAGSRPQLSSTYLPKSTSEHHAELHRMAHQMISSRCPNVLDIYRDAYSRCQAG